MVFHRHAPVSLVLVLFIWCIQPAAVRPEFEWEYSFGLVPDGQIISKALLQVSNNGDPVQMRIKTPRYATYGMFVKQGKVEVVFLDEFDDLKFLPGVYNAFYMQASGPINMLTVLRMDEDVASFQVYPSQPFARSFIIPFTMPRAFLVVASYNNPNTSVTVGTQTKYLPARKYWLILEGVNRTTRIISSRPISVQLGSRQCKANNYCIVNLPSTATWGRKYYVPFFASESPKTIVQCYAAITPQAGPLTVISKDNTRHLMKFERGCAKMTSSIFLTSFSIFEVVTRTFNDKDMYHIDIAPIEQWPSSIRFLFKALDVFGIKLLQVLLVSTVPARDLKLSFDITHLAAPRWRHSLRAKKQNFYEAVVTVPEEPETFGFIIKALTRSGRFMIFQKLSAGKGRYKWTQWRGNRKDLSNIPLDGHASGDNNGGDGGDKVGPVLELEPSGWNPWRMMCMDFVQNQSVTVRARTCNFSRAGEPCVGAEFMCQKDSLECLDIDPLVDTCPCREFCSDCERSLVEKNDMCEKCGSKCARCIIGERPIECQFNPITGRAFSGSSRMVILKGLVVMMGIVCAVLGITAKNKAKQHKKQGKQTKALQKNPGEKLEEITSHKDLSADGTDFQTMLNQQKL